MGMFDFLLPGSLGDLFGRGHDEGETHGTAARPDGGYGVPDGGYPGAAPRSARDTSGDIHGAPDTGAGALFKGLFDDEQAKRAAPTSGPSSSEDASMANLRKLVAGVGTSRPPLMPQVTIPPPAPLGPTLSQGRAGDVEASHADAVAARASRKPAFMATTSSKVLNPVADGHLVPDAQPSTGLEAIHRSSKGVNQGWKKFNSTFGSVAPGASRAMPYRPGPLGPTSAGGVDSMKQPPIPYAPITPTPLRVPMIQYPRDED